MLIKMKNDSIFLPSIVPPFYHALLRCGSFLSSAQKIAEFSQGLVIKNHPVIVHVWLNESVGI